MPEEKNILNWQRTVDNFQNFIPFSDGAATNSFQDHLPYSKPALRTPSFQEDSFESLLAKVKEKLTSAKASSPAPSSSSSSRCKTWHFTKAPAQGTRSSNSNKKIEVLYTTIFSTNTYNDDRFKNSNNTVISSRNRLNEFHVIYLWLW